MSDTDQTALVPQPHGGAIYQGRPPGYSNPGTGRPNGLTPEIQNTIISTIKAGNYLEAACGQAGVTQQTVYGWLQRGEAGEEPYREFFELLTRAQSESEREAVKAIKDRFGDDLKAPMWWLERRFPRRWGKQQRIDLTVTPDLDVDI